MTEPSQNSALNGLVELSNRTGADIRPTLLRVMTDLYLQKPAHSEAEEAEYTRMALKLIDHVDAKTRAMIAGKIAGYPNAPAAVRQRLLKDHIVCKAPEEPAQEATQESAQQSTKQPAEQSAKETTKQSTKPAAAPLSRGKAAALELSELFFTCNAEERRLVLLNLPYAPIAPADSLGAASAQSAVQKLEAAALAHQTERFARDLGRALSISLTQALRLTHDAGGEPIVVAASALRMPAAALQRILLCLNPAIGRSVQRVYDLTLLHEELKAASALRLIAIWQAADREEKKPAASNPVPVPRAPPQAADDRSRALIPVSRPKIRWEELARKADSA
jgi:hypothetical protein